MVVPHATRRNFKKNGEAQNNKSRRMMLCGGPAVLWWRVCALVGFVSTLATVQFISLSSLNAEMTDWGDWREWGGDDDSIDDNDDEEALFIHATINNNSTQTMGNSARTGTFTSPGSFTRTRAKSENHLKVFLMEHKDTTEDQQQQDECCWILANSLRMLDCGNDGMVFKAIMECSEDDAETTTRKIALKVPTLRTMNSDVSSSSSSVPPNITFVTETEESITNAERVYSTLYTNTPQSIRRHFAIAFGTVSVSPRLLLKAVEQHYTKLGANDPNWRCYHVLRTSRMYAPPQNNRTTDPPVVITTVLDFAKGSRLDPSTLTSPKQRRRVAKDLLCIYDHMYHRNFMHNDISFYHIYDDGKQATLVDFSRVLDLKYRTDRNPYEVQRIQLFQLMTLLGNVCTQSYERFEVPSVAITSYLHRIDGVKHNLSSALVECDFPHQPPASRIPVFFGPGRHSTGHTYRVLSKWMDGGSCSNHKKKKTKHSVAVQQAMRT